MRSAPPTVGLKVVAAPSAEPVTAAEAKLWARVDTSADDALIGSLITTARQYLEDTWDRAFIKQQLQMSLETFPGSRYGWTNLSSYEVSKYAIRLPRAPYLAVTDYPQIQYLDADGVLQSAEKESWVLVAKSQPARIVPAQGCIWPVTLQQPESVTVTYYAGYGDTAASVPEGVKTAIKMLVSHWYQNREPAGQVGDEIAYAVRALMAQSWHGWLT